MPRSISDYSRLQGQDRDEKNDEKYSCADIACCTRLTTSALAGAAGIGYWMYVNEEWQYANGKNTFQDTCITSYQQGYTGYAKFQFEGPYYWDVVYALPSDIAITTGVTAGLAPLIISAGAYNIGRSLGDFATGKFSSGFCRLLSGIVVTAGGAVVAIYAAPTLDWNSRANKIDGGNLGYQTGYYDACMKTNPKYCVNPYTTLSDCNNTASGFYQTMAMSTRVTTGLVVAAITAGAGFFTGLGKSLSVMRNCCASRPQSETSASNLPLAKADEKQEVVRQGGVTICCADDDRIENDVEAQTTPAQQPQATSALRRACCTIL